MPLYDYRAIDDYGKSHDGQLKAEDEKDLEKKLAEKGYYLLEAKEVRAIVKVSKPVKKAVPIKEDVPPGFRNTVTEGAKEIHLHQHIHQAPEPPKPSLLDSIGRSLQIAGIIITLLVSGFFAFSIFCLIVYLFSPSESKTPNPQTQAIQTKKVPEGDVHTKRNPVPQSVNPHSIIIGGRKYVEGLGGGIDYIEMPKGAPVPSAEILAAEGEQARKFFEEEGVKEKRNNAPPTGPPSSFKNYTPEFLAILQTADAGTFIETVSQISDFTMIIVMTNNFEIMPYRDRLLFARRLLQAWRNIRGDPRARVVLSNNMGQEIGGTGIFSGDIWVEQ